MRIVYDDAQINVLVNVVKDIITNQFASAADMQCVIKYDFGINRVEVALLKAQLDKKLKEKGFEIGNDVYHKNGIGNNNRYPVYYETANEKQQCGFLNINNDMYGGVYIYIADYNQIRHGKLYHLTYTGYSIS